MYSNMAKAWGAKLYESIYIIGNKNVRFIQLSKNTLSVCHACTMLWSKKNIFGCAPRKIYFDDLRKIYYDVQSKNLSWWSYTIEKNYCDVVSKINFYLEMLGKKNYCDVLSKIIILMCRAKKKKNILMGSPKNIFKILKYKEIPTKVQVTSHLEVNWGKNKPCLYIWKEKIHFLAKGKEKYLKSCQVDEIRKYNKKGLKLTAAKEVHKGRRWMAIPISVDLRKKWRKYKRC